MKRVFPLIVVLITLSVLGIIFIQMSWIRDAIKLKQKQRTQDLNNATLQIKESAYTIFLRRNNIGYLDEESKNYYLQKFTVQALTDDEVGQIIDKSLKRFNIKEPYEYSITNIFRVSIAASKDFKPST